ncbi:PilZ domain-containing protein [Oceanospirillum sediminis]|uniref:PilZ domain-containing protein n=1 Tax=Oceanospirillum sediminis TaxID=2760088 RepID=A0A839INM3_9GAMM|nr:PilZ domain-containing protein [Oceanospirillum sediminis]
MMNFISPFDEKRKYPRVRINSPVSIIVCETHQESTGHCLDLSTSGLRITMDSPLNKGTEVFLILRSPLGLDPFCTRARVIHNEPGEKARTGLEILEVIDEDEIQRQKSSSRSMSSRSESKLSST